jgi:outer membrane biosynthesis protein TonB
VSFWSPTGLLFFKYEQREQREQREQYERSKQYEQSEQPEQPEQYEQREQSEQSEQYEQPEQYEQREQPEQPEQREQREQPEQREQREQPEQSEQYEQSEQPEQPEQLIQLSQFFRPSRAACAFSFEPKYSTEHLFPRASSIQVIMGASPVSAAAGTRSALRPAPRCNLHPAAAIRDARRAWNNQGRGWCRAPPAAARRWMPRSRDSGG